jgi:catechol 2,3-dioxygenase-like lactoylglutathione lyase family enzyme
MRKLLFAASVLAGIAPAAFSPAHADQVPGIRGLDHVALTVPDLKQAIAFFTDVLGCSQPSYAIGPFKFDDDWMQVHLNVDPRAEITELAMLRCFSGSNVELFQYKAEGQVKTEPRNSDIGGHHLGFYVDDEAAAVAYLKSKGVKMLGDPTPFNQGPLAGETIDYFLTPWGAQMEILSYPKGLGYEAAVPTKLWSPKDPAN